MPECQDGWWVGALGTWAGAGVWRGRNCCMLYACACRGTYIQRFGAKPPRNSQLWKSVESTSQACESDPVVGGSFFPASTHTKAIRFLAAYESGKSLKRFDQWVRNGRHRFQLLPSVLDTALRSLVVFGTGVHRRNELAEGQTVLITRASSAQLNQMIISDVHVPRWNIDTAIGVLGLTPYLVVNWLYQALIDVTRVLRCILGSGYFDSCGALRGDVDLTRLCLGDGDTHTCACAHTHTHARRHARTRA